MKVFQNLTKKYSINKPINRTPVKRIDIEELLKTATISSTKVIKKQCLPPTSSFRCQSREDWYKPFHKDPSPPCFYDLNYSLTERHVQSPKYFPIIKKESSCKDSLLKKSKNEVPTLIRNYKERIFIPSTKKYTISLLQKSERLNKTK